MDTDDQKVVGSGIGEVFSSFFMFLTVVFLVIVGIIFYFFYSAASDIESIF